MIKARKSLKIIAGIIVLLVAVVGTYLGLVAAGEVVVQKAELEILINDIEKEYDGLPAEPSYRVNGVYNKNNQIKVEYSFDAVDAGDYVINASAKVFDKDNYDISDSFHINVHPGSCKILPRSVDVLLKANSKEYDGTPLKNTDFEVSDKLLSGHKLIPTFKTSVTSTTDKDVKATISALIIDSVGNDITKNYNVNMINDEADLVITKRPITIRSESKEKVFDGKHLISPEPICEGLLPGHTIEYDKSTLESIINFGEIPNDINSLSYTIYDANHNDVSCEYQPVLQSRGTLKIKRRPVNIKLPSIEDAFYTGQKMSFKITPRELRELLSPEDLEVFDEIGHSFSIKEDSFNAFDEVGTYTNSFDVKVLDIFNVESNDIDLNVEFASVTIKPVKVEITPEDIVSQYTGEKIEANENSGLNIEVLSSDVAFVPEAKAKYTIDSYGINVGSYENKILDVNLFNGSNDVTKNYDIKLIPGKITITPVDLNIGLNTGASLEFEYNNKNEFEINDDKLLVDNLKKGDSLHLTRNVVTTSDIFGNNLTATLEEKYVVIMNKYKEDVTKNYNISIDAFDCNIIQREVIVYGDKINDLEFGTVEEMNKDLDKISRYDKATNFIGNEVINVSYKVDEQNLSLKDVYIPLTMDVVVKIDDEVVTDRFKIKSVTEALSVKPRVIEVSTSDINSPYTGNEILFDDANGNTFTYLNPVDESFLESLSIGYNSLRIKYPKFTNSGQYDNFIEIDFTNEFKEVSKKLASSIQYEIGIQGTIKIGKAEISTTLLDGSEIELNDKHFDKNGKIIDLGESWFTQPESFTQENSPFKGYKLKCFPAQVGGKDLSLTEIINPEEFDLDLNKYYVYDQNGNNVTSNFILKKSDNKLNATVGLKPFTLTVVGSLIEQPYNPEFMDPIDITKFSFELIDPTNLFEKTDLNFTFIDFENNETVRDVGITYISDTSPKELRLGDWVISEDIVTIDILPERFGVKITPKEVTIVNPSQTIYYGGSVQKIEPIINGADPSIYQPNPINISELGVGTYEITSDIPANKNYDITFINGTLTILPAKKMITLPSGSFEYDGTKQQLEEYQYPDLNPIIKATPVGYTNAGTYFGYTIEQINMNYDIQIVGGMITITPQKKIIKLDSKTLTYNGTEQQLEAYSDAYVTATPIAYTNVGTYSGYNIEQKSSNYDVDIVGGNITIQPKKLIVELPSAIFEYDGTANKLPDYTANSTILTVEAKKFINVGSYFGYTISQIDNNYELQITGGNLTITKGTKVVNIDNKIETYTGGDFSLVIPSSGIPSGITIKAVTKNLAGVYPNAYTISGTNPNYNVAVHGGTLTITKAKLTIELPSKTFEYDGANKNLGAYAKYTNIVTCTPKDISKLGSHFGYKVDQINDNYELTIVGGILNIVKGKKTIYIPNKTVEYNGLPQELDIPTDLPKGVEITAISNTDAQVYSNNSAYTVVNNSNYDLEIIGGTLEITKKKVTFDLGVNETIYSGGKASVPSISGMGGLVTELKAKVLTEKKVYTNANEVYEITISMEAYQNYEITFTGVNVTVN